jgi:protein-disulfide isomerase
VQTGKVRFGYIHFTFLGQESIDAAQASECAGEQDAFWEYHDLLFDNQNGENRGAFNLENLVSLADQAGIDVEAFQTCLDSGKYASLVSSQTQFTQSIGVRSTPSFLVNGVPVIGAQGFDVFDQIIEEQLNQSGN